MISPCSVRKGYQGVKCLLYTMFGCNPEVRCRAYKALIAKANVGVCLHVYRNRCEFVRDCLETSCKVDLCANHVLLVIFT